MKKLFYLSIFVLALTVVAAGICAKLYMDSIPERVGETVAVRVEEGQNAREAAMEFERSGAVTNARSLARWMARTGIDKRLLPGLYRVTAGRPRDVAAQLADMRPEIPSAMILPGATFEEIAGVIGRPDGEALLASALADENNFPPELRKFLPAGERDRIILLSPETYAVVSGEQIASRLVAAAAAMWWKQHGALLPEELSSDGLNSLGILASIVQKEALIQEERPVIAGVFNNRLDLDMPLQSCATVVYAWKLRGVKKTNLSYNDVQVDSPFNTYIHKGLPPENIGVPSRDSWNAALEPANTDMLFFFARADGSHIFTKTYREHLDAQRRESRQL